MGGTLDGEQHVTNYNMVIHEEKIGEDVEVNAVHQEAKTTDDAACPNEAEASSSPDFVFDLNVVANILALCLLVSSTVWNQLIPSSAIPFIAARFPAGASSVAWISIAPSVCGAVIQAIIGDVSDIFGRRVFLLSGCAFGVGGTLVGGRANSIEMVIGGQVLNGIAIALAFLAQPALQEIVPKNLRPVAVACATFVSSFSFICGPIIEGVLIQNKVGGELEGWRAGFYIGAGMWVISLGCLAIFYHPMDRPNNQDLKVSARVRQLDWLGIFLATAGLTSFLVGLNYGRNPYPWASATVLAPMLLGAATIVAFLLWEWKGTSVGILPHALFRDRNYIITLVVRVIGGFALIGSQAYLPQIAVYVFGTGGLRTAVWQLPFSISTVIGAFCSAILLRVFKQVRWITVGTLALMTLGAGLMIAVKPGSHFALWFFGSTIIGISVGIEASLLSVVSSLFVPNELIATGVCVASSTTLLGGGIAVTMYNAVFTNELAKSLPTALSNAAVEAGLPQSSLGPFLAAFVSGNTANTAIIAGATPQILANVTQASRSAYSHALQQIWYILISFSAFCGFTALLFTSTEKYLTSEVTAPVKSKSKPLQGIVKRA